MEKTFTINCYRPELTLSYKTISIPGATQPNFYVNASYPYVEGYNLEWYVVALGEDDNASYTVKTGTDRCNVFVGSSGTYEYNVTCQLRYGDEVINTENIQIIYTQ